MAKEFSRRSLLGAAAAGLAGSDRRASAGHRTHARRWHAALPPCRWARSIFSTAKRTSTTWRFTPRCRAQPSAAASP